MAVLRPGRGEADVVPSARMFHITALILLAAVEIGGGFGEATAEVISQSEASMEVEVQVEVQTTADAVVAHFALSGEDPVTLPLLSRGDGVYGITTELRPANYQVVFETLGDDPAQSAPVTLTDLGADISNPSGSVTTTTEDGFSAATEGWGWLALAFTAASLAALAFWVLGSASDRRDADPEPDSEEVEVEPSGAAADDQPSTDSTPAS